MKIETIDGVRYFTCSVCGRSEPWDIDWRWRSSVEYLNDVRVVLATCSDECREAPHAHAAWGTLRYAS